MHAKAKVQVRGGALKRHGEEMDRLRVKLSNDHIDVAREVERMCSSMIDDITHGINGNLNTVVGYIGKSSQGASGHEVCREIKLKYAHLVGKHECTACISTFMQAHKPILHTPHPL